jgi:two-component system, LytTR family, sensor kinase
MREILALYRRWQVIVLSVVGWTLIGLFFSFQSYFQYIYFNRPMPFWIPLVGWLTCSYLWALVTPLVIGLAWRFPLEKTRLLRRLPLHLLAGALVSSVLLVLYVFLRELFLGDAPKPFSPVRGFLNLFVADFHSNLLFYWMIVVLSQAFDYYRRFRERERRAAQLELEAAQLETQLTRAELDALKMQLHPHFLFNTLNTISVLMRDDIEAANRMLVRLSELLRAALKSEGAQEVPLRQELEFLRGYLEIEQTRFQDRLTVEFFIEPETLDAQVPNLILQPLVENAIRHGIAPRAEAGLIQIQARRENGFVELRISDNGAGISESKAEIAGIGLSNTRERLEKLYGQRHEFSVVSGADGGVQAAIKIPYRKNKNES